MKGYTQNRSDGREVCNTCGSGGSAKPQRPIPGPENAGPPIAMRKALAKKDNSGKGMGLPSKNTSYAGSI